jgi:hypothetical protein
MASKADKYGVLGYKNKTGSQTTLVVFIILTSLHAVAVGQCSQSKPRGLCNEL